MNRENTSPQDGVSLRKKDKAHSKEKMANCKPQSALIRNRIELPISGKPPRIGSGKNNQGSPHISMMKPVASDPTRNNFFKSGTNGLKPPQ